MRLKNCDSKEKVEQAGRGSDIVTRARLVEKVSIKSRCSRKMV